MRGMDAKTGKTVEGAARVRSSILDILTTDLGERVELRQYGSEIGNLIDRPMNELLVVELFSAVAICLEKWEPEFKLNSVWIEGKNAQGRLQIGIDGVIVSSGQVVRIEGISL